MKKTRLNNIGFTLAELLIVVAIIGILVAISIPIFNSQLERAREATDASNIRSQYSMVMAEAITTDKSVNGQELCGAVQLTQHIDGWSSESIKDNLESVYGEHITGTRPSKGGTAWVEYNADGGYPILHYEGAGSGTESGGSDSGGGSPADVPPFIHETLVDWNDVQTSGNAYTITRGDVYFWNGNYYIGTKDETIDQWNVQNRNPDTFTEWFTLAKYTSEIHDISYYNENPNTMPATKRGDICKVGDDYYVFSDGGDSSYGPIIDSNRWTKIN
jgi:type IV pilus assembly protein PilA